MEKKRVGVLRGGPGTHYRSSLESGQVILKNLPKDQFEAIDIFVDTRGVWHIDGVPVTLPEVRERVDIIVNALHGAYGSDGQLQRQLELHHIPYTGSGVTGSANAYHRQLSKELLAQFGIRTPHGILIRHDDSRWQHVVQRFFKNHPGPYVVKSASGHGTSHHAKTYPDLLHSVESFIVYGHDVILEEHISGTESLVGVIEGYRNQRYYTTIPSKGTHDELEHLARKVHTTLGLRDYSVVHVINSRRGLFVVKAVAHPELKEGAHLLEALRSVGCSEPEFLRHLLK